MPLADYKPQFLELSTNLATQGSTPKACKYLQGLVGDEITYLDSHILGKYAKKMLFSRYVTHIPNMCFPDIQTQSCSVGIAIINHPPVIATLMGGINHQKWVVDYCCTLFMFLGKRIVVFQTTTACQLRCRESHVARQALVAEAQVGALGLRCSLTCIDFRLRCNLFGHMYHIQYATVQFTHLNSQFSSQSTTSIMFHHVPSCSVIVHHVSCFYHVLSRIPGFFLVS